MSFAAYPETPVNREIDGNVCIPIDGFDTSGVWVSEPFIKDDSIYQIYARKRFQCVHRQYVSFPLDNTQPWPTTTVLDAFGNPMEIEIRPAILPAEMPNVQNRIQLFNGMDYVAPNNTNMGDDYESNQDGTNTGYFFIETADQPDPEKWIPGGQLTCPLSSGYNTFKTIDNEGVRRQSDGPFYAFPSQEANWTDCHIQQNVIGLPYVEWNDGHIGWDFQYKSSLRTWQNEALFIGLQVYEWISFEAYKYNFVGKSKGGIINPVLFLIFAMQGMIFEQGKTSKKKHTQSNR